MNINKQLFCNHFINLEQIINDKIADSKEKQHRIRALTLAYENNDVDRFLQLAHELESYAFLLGLGDTRLSMDSRGESGVDLLFNNSIYIECVCCTKGRNDGIDETTLASLARPVTCRETFGCAAERTGLFDYRLEADTINSRITSVLKDKLDFYQNHIENDQIIEGHPYIIFLSYGTLYMHVDDDPGRLTEVLVGRGYPQILINKETGEIVEGGFDYRECFTKTNNVSLKCNIFLNESYKAVSGILLATEQQRYSVDNVVLYINPFASNKIEENAIPAKRTWDILSSGNYGIK